MLVLPVSIWVTLWWGLLIHRANALNTTPVFDELATDYAIERSAQLAQLEGSGVDDVGDIGNDDATLTLLPFVQSTKNNIRKRAADFYNGFVGPQFYWPFTISAPRFPANAVLGLSRPLQRGHNAPNVEYVAIWYPKGEAPHWGSVYFDQRMRVEGTFIQNGRIMNLTRPSMAKEPVRLLQYVGTPESNNFKFVWTIAKNLDPATAISLRMQSNPCSPRLAPAVFQDDGYEFLGEADIDNRSMQYVFQGHVYTVDKSQFLSKVYVLTKQRCSCSCAGGTVQR